MVQRRNPHAPPRMVYGGYTPPPPCGPVMLGCGVARVCGVVCFGVAGGCVVYPASPLWPCGGPAVLAYMHAYIHTTTSMQCIASSSKPRFQDHTIRGGWVATRDTGPYIYVYTCSWFLSCSSWLVMEDAPRSPALEAPLTAARKGLHLSLPVVAFEEPQLVEDEAQGDWKASGVEEVEALEAAEAEVEAILREDVLRRALLDPEGEARQRRKAKAQRLRGSGLVGSGKHVMAFPLNIHNI